MRKAIGVIIGVVIIAAVGFGAWWFLVGSAQTTTNIEEAVQPLDTSAASESSTVFRIVPEQSTAEFNIGEVLNGEPFTVVGTTNQVIGDIVIDATTPANSQVGTITINARSFATDNSFRDGAIRNNILLSAQDENEFITFEPTALNNMPESVTIGEAFSFDIVGNLTILTTTREVTFAATVTPVSETEISGNAETTIQFADFGVQILRTPPQVASVEESVVLKLNFVATQVSEDAAAEDATEEEAPVAEPEATEEAS